MRTDLPDLDVYISENCPTCARTLAVLDSCEELVDLVHVRVHVFVEGGPLKPRSVIGVPTTMCRGRVLALGTPDCTQLVGDLRAMIANEERHATGQVAPPRRPDTMGRDPID